MSMTTVESLVYQIRNGEDPSGEKMLALMKAVEGISFLTAKPFLRAGFIDSEELPSIAFLAASEGVRKWDPDGGMSFASYYKMCLLTEILRGSGAAVHVPYGVRSRIRQYRQYLNNYRSRHGGESPNDPDVCKDLGITGADLQQIRMAEQALYVSYLDAPVSDDEDSVTVVETIPDWATDVETTCLEQIFRAELAETLYKACESLSEQERQCLTLRFKKGLTLCQTAAEMGLEAKTVRKLSDKALRRLRDRRNGLSGFLRERTLTQHVGFDSWAHNGASSPEMLILKYEQHDYGKWH